MRLALAAWLCALLLAPHPATAQAAPDQRDYSAAERLLFMTPQLQGLQMPTQLRYSFARTGSLQAALTDSVRVDLRAGADGRCCDATGQFLSGAHQQPAPEVTAATGNPVILYFLEHDIREMKRLTKGSMHHFRKRLRMAIYQGAEVREVPLRYQGRSIQGREISITPFLDDPNRPRYERFAQKTYRFVLSDAVPGGVYGIRTSIPDASADAPPLIVEQLLITGATASPP